MLPDDFIQKSKHGKSLGLADMLCEIRHIVCDGLVNDELVNKGAQYPTGGICIINSDK